MRLHDSVLSGCTSRTLHLLLSLAVVFLGGMLYLLFRPVEPLFFTWFGFSNEGGWLINLRTHTLPLSPLLPGWLIFSLPTGLWAMAYTLLICTLWNGSKSGHRYFWYLSLPVFLFGIEFIQRTSLLRGTFCWEDILFTAAGIAAAWLLFRFISRN